MLVALAVAERFGEKFMSVRSNPRVGTISRTRIIVPGGTITLADLLRGNEYASGFVPSERIHGGTNPLLHRSVLDIPSVRSMF